MELARRSDITNSAGTDDWLQASRNMLISACPEELSGLRGDFFTKLDFEQALKKVSHKRNKLVGEHIQEAIQIIKGTKD